MPVRASASGALGVSSAARGIISRFTASTAASGNSGCPPLATMTGSTTAGASALSSRAATVSTTSTEPSIPVLKASVPMSSSTARPCAAIRSSGRGWTP